MFWRQHPTTHQLYGHLPPVTKTIQCRTCRTLISDVLLWTPTHGRAKARRPVRTYIQQLCEDTGCCPEDLPEAMNDREKWRERVRDIRATSTTWWWWWWWYIYIYSCNLKSHTSHSGFIFIEYLSHLFTISITYLNVLITIFTFI